MKSKTTYHISQDYKVKKYRGLEITESEYNYVLSNSESYRQYYERCPGLVYEEVGYPVPLRGFGIVNLLKDSDVVKVEHDEPVEVTAFDDVHGGFGRCSLINRIFIYLLSGEWHKKIR